MSRYSQRLKRDRRIMLFVMGLWQLLFMSAVAVEIEDLSGHIADFHLLMKARIRPGYASYVGCKIIKMKKWPPPTDIQRMTTFGSVDVTGCIGACWGGQYCLCSNVLTGVGRQSASNLCSLPCVGNPGQACGGPVQVSVYYTGKGRPDGICAFVNVGYMEELSFRQIKPKGLDKAYQGCKRESPGAGWCIASSVSPRMSLLMCLSLCEMNYYQFAIMDTPYKCCCSRTVNVTSSSVAKEECYKPCQGDPSHWCGGQDQVMSVYSTGVSDKVATKAQKSGHKLTEYLWMKPNIKDSILQHV